MHLFIVLLLSIVFSPCLCWYPRVVTPQGPIVGRTDISRDGRRFFMFDGIPYAKPPTGELRFKPPEPVDPWTEDFDANRPQIVCIQTAWGHHVGMEDCLVLNVYTPRLIGAGGLMSVIVSIHGGDFTCWTHARLLAGGPEFFMDEDIVLVTMNYRLGIMGFMSTEDEVAPGNYGLLDQQMALQWIQKNIESFNGNPNSVMLAGISAGAASIHMHMASPLSQGLFHKALIQSGTALSRFLTSTSHKEGVEGVAWMLDCPTASSSDILQCLREKDAEDIVKAVDDWYTFQINRGERFMDLPQHWTPRKDIESQAPFLPVDPYEAFQSGEYSQIPCIVGNAKDEFIYTEEFPPLMKNDFNKLNTEWKTICKLLLSDIDVEQISSQLLEEVCDKIHQRYLQDFDLQNMDNVIKMLKYVGLLHGVHKAVEIMVQHNHPVYYYSIDHYREDQCVFQVWFHNFTKTTGAVHANDLIYLFTFPMIRLDDDEVKVSRTYFSILTSFANTGIPTFPDQDVQWLPTSSPDYEHLRLDEKSYITKRAMDENYDFWEEIDQMLRKPINNNGINRDKDEL